MPQDMLSEQLAPYLEAIRQQLATPTGDWTVRGFIDVYKHIYTISLDTKVLSKVLELLMLPVFMRFADEQGYELILAKAQNHYPDLTLIARADASQCFAIDIKTTYLKQADKTGQMRVSGMTLGTFGGYFRNRTQATNSTLPYEAYRRHYVLGVVYRRVTDIDESRIYSLDELENIPAVAHDFQLFFHEKYLIASDKAGSGNTRNIGSSVYLERLLNGTGVFAKLGVEVFDDYWMHYRTQAMARQEGLTTPPYSNLKGYHAHKQQGASILNLSPQEIESEADDDENNQ